MHCFLFLFCPLNKKRKSSSTILTAFCNHILILFTFKCKICRRNARYMQKHNSSNCFYVHIFNVHANTWLRNRAGSRPTSRGSSKSDNDAPHPVTLPPSLHESIHLFPCPKAEKLRPSIAGSCQPEVFCWTAPITRAGSHTDTHHLAKIERIRAHSRQQQSVLNTLTNCTESMLGFSTVSTEKKMHFPSLFLKHPQVFSVLVDVWYTGGKHSPLVCWINAMSDPWCFI